MARSQATSTTGNGAWRVTTSGLNGLRARVSAFTSGTVAVTLTSSPGSSGNNGGGGGGGGCSPSCVTSVSVTGDGVVDSNAPSTPVTSSGTLPLTILQQAANTIFGNPTAGSAAPQFFSVNSPLGFTGTALGCPGCSAGSGATGQLATWLTSSTLGGINVTGTGMGVLQTSPSLVAPNLGTPSALNLANAVGLLCPGMPALTGDTTSSAGSCSTTTSKINGNVLPTSAVVVGTNGSAAPVAAATTGTGSTVVLSTNPALTSPNLGTPSAVNLANATNLPCAGLPPLTGDTTSSGCATTTAKINGTAFPTSAVIVGSNGSAQPVAASTTGSGSTAVLATNPTLVTPNLGIPSALNLANARRTCGNAAARPASLTGDTTASARVLVIPPRQKSTGLPFLNIWLRLFPVLNGSAQPVAANAHGLATPLACSDSSGSGTAQAGATTPSYTPAAGDWIIYKTTTTNTGDLTINVNSTSAIHVRKFQGSSVLVSGDLAANVPMLLQYDGTYWEIYTTANAPVPSGTITSQVLTAVNGSPATFASPGIPGRNVSGTTDTILCDSGTTLQDRGGTITYTSTSKWRSRSHPLPHLVAPTISRLRLPSYRCPDRRLIPSRRRLRILRL